MVKAWSKLTKRAFFDKNNNYGRPPLTWKEWLAMFCGYTLKSQLGGKLLLAMGVI